MNAPREALAPAETAAQLDANTGTKAGAQVGISRPHESAHLHVAGAAPYIDDLPEIQGTLHAALGLSPVAHGRLLAITANTGWPTWRSSPSARIGSSCRIGPQSLVPGRSAAV